MKNGLLALTLFLTSTSAMAFSGTKFYKLKSCETCVAAIDFQGNVPVKLHRFNWGQFGNTSVNESIVLDGEEGEVLRYRASSRVVLYVEKNRLNRVGYGFITRIISDLLIEKK